MMDIAKMVQAEIALGYSDLNARAKVCQDIVLKAIASGPLSRNVTIKGGVVMRSKTKNVRRATQDLDIDFLRYPLTDSAIDTFIASMGRLEGITIKRFGSIEELRLQEYKGKRVHIEIADSNGNKIQSKIDLGVHSRLDIDQEMFCFDIALDSEGASLLINSSEQMFAEKLRSLLKFGSFSTRFKDVFDLYYLSGVANKTNLLKCLDAYIFSDNQMRENSIADVVKRLEQVFSDKAYLKRLSTSGKNWLGIDVEEVTKGILFYIDCI